MTRIVAACDEPVKAGCQLQRFPPRLLWAFFRVHQITLAVLGTWYQVLSTECVPNGLDAIQAKPQAASTSQPDQPA